MVSHPLREISYRDVALFGDGAFLDLKHVVVSFLSGEGELGMRQQFALPGDPVFDVGPVGGQKDPAFGVRCGNNNCQLPPAQVAYRVGVTWR